MSQVSNSIDSLRQWFRQCPLLSKSNRFGADYLGENPTEYAIYASPYARARECHRTAKSPSAGFMVCGWAFFIWGAFQFFPLPRP